MRLTPNLTSLKTLNITHQTPQETLTAPAVALPTTEPGTSQVIYTVASGDIPTLDFSLKSSQYCILMLAAGKFATAGTLSWRVLKNTVSQYVGSGAVALNQYFTLHAHFNNVSIADVLEIRIWSNQIDSVYDYKAYQMQLSRIKINLREIIVKNAAITISYQPVLTLGTPNQASRGDLNLYLHADTSNIRGAWGPTSQPATNTYEFLGIAGTYGIYRLAYGDYVGTTAASLRTHASNRPQYEYNVAPTKIVLRGIAYL